MMLPVQAQRAAGEGRGSPSAARAAATAAAAAAAAGGGGGSSTMTPSGPATHPQGQAGGGLNPLGKDKTWPGMEEASTRLRWVYGA